MNFSGYGAPQLDTGEKGGGVDSKKTNKRTESRGKRVPDLVAVIRRNVEPIRFHEGERREGYKNQPDVEKTRKMGTAGKATFKGPLTSSGGIETTKKRGA